MLESSPEKVHGRHYDFVCNGYEIAGGSIRIHNTDLQRRVFRLMGYPDEKIIAFRSPAGGSSTAPRPTAEWPRNRPFRDVTTGRRDHPGM